MLMNVVWGAVVLLLVAGFALWWFYPAILARVAFTLVTSHDPGMRLEGLDPLARLAFRGYPNAFEALDRATEDPDETVRRAALRYVQELGQALGRLPLTETFFQQDLDRLKALLLSDNPTARAQAAEQLRQRGDPWLYQAGIQMRADCRSGTVEQRRRVLVALGLLGDQLAGSYLSGALQDTEPTLRREAAEAAGRIGPSRCLPLLAHLAGEDPNPQVRAAAQHSLQNLKSQLHPPGR